MIKRLFFSILVCWSSVQLNAQVETEYVGLAGQALTDLDINFGLIAVGTERNGVYWQPDVSVVGNGWSQIALDSSVQSVYPHKSGPVGWAISAGIQTTSSEPPFVFCSYLGQDFEANSDGIGAQISGIVDLDGFPDPTVCGETYAVGDRILYRRYFTDTIWEPVLTATVEGYLQAVKVHERFPGVVLAGGADGFAGIFLAKSLDFGETWRDISPFGITYDIDFDGAEADTIFVAAWDKIFRTTDGGENWATIYQDGNSYQFTEILYERDHKTLYAAGGTSTNNRAVLMYSHNLGDSWQQVDLDTLDTILGLEEGANDWTYIITGDQGVYRFRDVVSGTEEPETHASTGLTSIYPNPANSRTTVTYELAESAPVKLQILNTDGKIIRTVVDQIVSPGRQQMVFDVSQLAAGVYYVSLEAGTVHDVSRMVVNR